MRIERLHAVAFGPLRGETLSFRSGMNVFCGGNESGKSSWHAALYAGLCGLRRGRGRRAEERDFAEAYRPWTGEEWAVVLTLCLDAGRRIELRQNLADLAACQATDLDLGRDVLAEVTNEGTPDGALWLGLDRTSFPLLACVRQARILAVLEDPERLQEFIQRAAASAGGDATTAEALQRLEEFRRENVGADRRGAVKPLRCAIEAHARVLAELEEARRVRAELESVAKQAERARAAARRDTRRLRILEAVRALAVARRAAERVARVRELAALFPHGRPAAPVEFTEMEGPAASAETRPVAPVLTWAVLAAGVFLAGGGAVLLAAGRVLLGALVLGGGLLVLVAAVLRAAGERRERRTSGEAAQAAGRKRWLADTRDRLREQQRLLADWSRLEALLDGTTLAEMEEEAAGRRARAGEKMVGVEVAEVEAVEEADAGDEQIEAARRAARASGEAASRLAGELARAERDLPPVAELEEDLARAERARQQVSRLDETLRRTRDFLEAAEERVHRDIAPVLEKTLNEWLPRVTGGRYHTAKVDPQDLAVRVLAGGGWRVAMRLSHGTAEQIYLLLRIALARHLGAREESCPLILDDVSVQSDALRTAALLDTLHELSGGQQVIVFSQEDSVRAWAERNLKGEDDQLVSLPVPAASGAPTGA